MFKPTIITIFISLVFATSVSFADNLSCNNFTIRPVFENIVGIDASKFKAMSLLSGAYGGGENYIGNEILLSAGAISDSYVKAPKPIWSPEYFEKVKNHPLADKSDPKTQEALRKLFVQGGDPQVVFEFNPSARKQFEKITTESQGKKLAFVLDDELILAATVMEPITDGKVVIFCPKEVINAQALANRLKDLSSRTLKN